MNSLKDWKTEILSSICNVEYGTRVVKKNDAGTLYPVYGGGGETFFVDSFNRDSRMIISRFAMSQQCVRFVEGKFYLNDSGLTVSSKNEDVLNQRFLDLLLMSKSEDIYNLSRGTAQKNLNMDGFREQTLSFPIALSEQHRIVKILDEAFADIAKAKEITEKNLKNARELFESYAQTILTSSSRNWQKKRLWELSTKKDAIVSGPFGSNLKVSDYTSEGIPILRLQNIGKGFFINKNIKFISQSKAEELKYHSFRAGDLVLAKLGIPIGKTCTIPPEIEYGIITADVVRIRPDEEVIDYCFLEYCLNTAMSVSQLTGNISGATRPRVNLSEVRNIQVSLPSLKVQREIVYRLNFLSHETGMLETIYKRKLLALEELKKSVLKKAFAGEL